MKEFDDQKTKRRVRGEQISRPVWIGLKGYEEVLSKSYNRFRVKRVAESKYSNGWLKNRAKSTVYELSYPELEFGIFMILVGPWDCFPHNSLETQTEIGVYGDFKENSQESESIFILLDGSETNRNFYLLNPDLFVNVTALSPSFFCVRKIWLDQRFFKTDRFNESEGILGTVKHNLFERVISSNDQLDDSAIKTYIEKEIILQNEFFLNKSADLFKSFSKEVEETVAVARRFRKLYLEEKKPVFGPAGQKLVLVRVAKTECSLSSAKFSCKGKADALIICQFYKHPDTALFEEVAVPFELKTGKLKEEHCHQVMLYSALLADGLREQLTGLLFYSGLESDLQMFLIEVRTISAMMRRRNEVSREMVYKGKPPEPIEKVFVCSNFCSQNSNCAFRHLSDRFKTGNESQEIEDLEKEKISVFSSISEILSAKIADEHSFKYAERILGAIDFEEIAETRQTDFDYGQYFSLSNLFALLHTFRKSPTAPLLATFDLFFSQNDLCPESVFFDFFSLDKTAIFKHRKSLFDFLEGKIGQRYFVHAFNFVIFKVYLLVNPSAVARLGQLEKTDKSFYNIYSSEWGVSQRLISNFQKMRSAVTNFLTNPELKDISSIIVERLSTKLSINDPLSRITPEFVENGNITNLLTEQLNLNGEQKTALRNSLNCEYFYLVQGFSGTGKNTFAVSLIIALINCKKRTLVICNSHRGLNNLLGQLYQKLEASQHRSVLRLITDKDDSRKDGFEVYGTEKFGCFEEYFSLINCHIFASTLLSISHFKIKPKDFDFVIVCEAAQIIEPLLLLVLPLGKKFVLVGDSCLLPPYTFAENSKLSKSLFERLYTQHSNNSFLLFRQYRMNADITWLVNRLVYSGKLAAASQETALQQLKVCYKEEIKTASWVKELLFHFNGVVFVDTSGIEFAENVNSKIEKANDHVEELISVELLNRLLSFGVRRKDLAIIVLSGKQKNFFTAQLPDFEEIFTLEQSQCIDVQVAILVVSLSLNSNIVYSSLKRINIALTRARCKLIVVADLKK